MSCLAKDTNVLCLLRKGVLRAVPLRYQRKKREAGDFLYKAIQRQVSDPAKGSRCLIVNKIE